MINLVPFIIALVITPLIRRLAVVGGITDDVDGDPLKIHREPVALLGGVAILVAMAVGGAVCGLRLAGSGWRLAVYGADIKQVMGIIIGGLLVFGAGLWDDVKGVKPVVRLLAQALAGVVVLLVGIRVNIIPALWIAIPLTLFYIAGAINAFNVTDGMDGLCAGVSLVSCVGFFFLGLNSGSMVLVVLSAILFMSLLGFLPYNLHPARIFLGDAGSGFLGFMLGVMAVMATSKPYNIADFIAPILILGIPVFDMAFAIFRRLILKRPLFSGDRDHLYDLLLKRSWSQARVWGVMCGMQAVLVGIAVLIY